MALGLDSVWHSSLTFAPRGAPTSWFGIHIIGETKMIYQSSKGFKILKGKTSGKVGSGHASYILQNFGLNKLKGWVFRFQLQTWV